MAKFKIIVSDPEAGTSSVVELEEARAVPLIGRRLGETLDGSIVNLPEHKVQITGGSDKDGFPLRQNIHGGVRRHVILRGGVGFDPQSEGLRRRKTVRGNVITDEVVQINMKIMEKPKGAKEAKKPKEKKPKVAAEGETEKPPEESPPPITG
jgi:small subunit ribosomal protein S6e